MRSRRASTIPACRWRSLWPERSSARSKKSSRRSQSRLRLPALRIRRRDLAAFAVIGAVFAGTLLTSRPNPVARPAVVVAPSPVVEQPVASTAPDFGSLDEDIGSVVVVSWRGTDINTVRSLLDDGRVGGVLLFGSNFNGPAGLASLTESLRALTSSAC